MKTMFHCRDGNGRQAVYSMDVLHGTKTVLVLGEVNANEGASITNNAERAWAEALSSLRLDPATTVCVEYYPANFMAGRSNATYDLVDLSPDYKPRWSVVKPEHWVEWGVPAPVDYVPR